MTRVTSTAFVLLALSHLVSLRKDFRELVGQRFEDFGDLGRMPSGLVQQPQPNDVRGNGIFPRVAFNREASSVTNGARDQLLDEPFQRDEARLRVLLRIQRAILRQTCRAADGAPIFDPGPLNGRKDDPVAARRELDRLLGRRGAGGGR